MSGPLAGRVALVAGATRGAGRGIAVELGAAGALVYCTGRSSREHPRPAAAAAAAAAGGGPFDLASRPETVEETADRVRAAGGSAVAVRVDHQDARAVAALVERIEVDEGRLDVLVNDIWGGDALTEWGKPLWELDLDRGLTLLQRAVHTHVITSRLALPLMLERRAGLGLILEITDGDALFYRGNFFYDIAKTTVIRMAFALAEELRPHGIAAVALTPGFLRSEAMLDHFGVTEESWRDAGAADPNFLFSETPRFVGRAAAALAADPEVMAKSGTLRSSWALAREYGFTDVDGSRPDWGAHARGQSFGKDQRESHRRFVDVVERRRSSARPEGG